MTAKVLVVEDDEAIAELLRYNLMAAGLGVEVARSGEDGLVLIEEQQPDLLILDWMLPGISGLEMCRQIRRKKELESLPVLMLTARGEEADRVRGLTTGADDYVVKPFSVGELMARVRGLLRRAAPERIADVLTAQDLVLDRRSHRLTRAGSPIKLSPTEYRLLEALMQSAGRVLTRNQLIDAVWGNTSEVDDRTVDVHVARLRRALTPSGETDPVRTVRGAGYILDT